MTRSSDISDITRLVLHERQGRDRSWWDQIRGCFAPDAVVRLCLRAPEPEFGGA